MFLVSRKTKKHLKNLHEDIKKFRANLRKITNRSILIAAAIMIASALNAKVGENKSNAELINVIEQGTIVLDKKIEKDISEGNIYSARNDLATLYTVSEKIRT